MAMIEETIKKRRDELKKLIWYTYKDLCVGDPVLQIQAITITCDNDLPKFEVTFSETFQIVPAESRQFIVILDVQEIRDIAYSRETKQFLDYLTQQLKQKRWEVIDD